jgi:hypothetical protein
VFLWGRLIKRAKFFGDDFEMNLVYIYDMISRVHPLVFRARKGERYSQIDRAVARDAGTC